MSGARFTRKIVVRRIVFFSGAVLYHAFEQKLRGGNGLLLGNAAADAGEGEFFHRFAVLLNFGHQFGLHQVAVISDRIVKRQRLQRRQFGFVADAHPGQRGTAPVVVIAEGLLDVGRVLALDLDARRDVEPELVHPLDELFGTRAVLAVEVLHHFGDADVRGLLEGSFHRSAVQPVVSSVLHHLVVHFPATQFQIERVVHIDVSVFEQCHHARQFEGRTRFGGGTHGIVVVFVPELVSLAAAFSQVRNGANGSGLYLHHHGGTVLGIVLFHGAVQGLLGNIL